MNGLLSMRHRTIRAAALLTILFSLVFTHYIPADELLSLNLGDASVSLNLHGRWKGTINASMGFAFTPLGSEALKGDTPFFMQEGDLSLSLWIWDRWFVEAGFMDDSALNTYRAGYQGRDENIIRYVGIGNTSLDFPNFPYLDLGGDSPSSFGAYGHFGAGKFSFHSLVRYDAAAREERIFVGDRERSYSYADLSRPQRGVSFVLPDDNLGSLPEVYIQDNKGTLTGSDGRRWRLAEASEYGASALHGLVELSLGNYTGGSSEPQTMIAVYYPGGYSLGAYGTPNPVNPGEGTGTTGFLGEVQKHFDLSGRTIHLAAYPQPGQQILEPGTVSLIPGQDALIIFEPGTFSPFERQNRYIAPVNTSYSAELVKLSNGTFIVGYEVIPLSEGAFDKLLFAPEINTERRSVYEMIPEGPRNRQSPGERWPLGNLYPEIYLPGRTVFTEDVGIRFTNYGSAGYYHIGTDVVPGSVQVYRNGILDPNISFSSYSGVVNLQNPAGFNEVIRISYLKQSTETRLGSLAAGLGAIWEPDGNFSGKLGIGLRWNVASGSFSENGATSPGTVGLGAEAKWDFQNLKAGVTLGLGFEQPDTTGLYRIAGMEENEWILPLPSETSFISEPNKSWLLSQRSELIFRNYRETSVFSGTTLGDISVNAGIVSGQSGPYPASDRQFSSQVLVAEFDFSSEENWTGFQTALGFNGEFLEHAGIIQVPYRFLNFSRTPEPDEISVIIEIGALAERDTGNTDNPILVMERKLFIPDSDLEHDFYNPLAFHEGARLATIHLTNEDRAKLQAAKFLRILVIWDKDKGSSDSLSGKVIFAPPIVRGANWRSVTVKGSQITTSKNNLGLGADVNVFEEKEWESGYKWLENKYPSIISRLHSESSRQRVLAMTWSNPASLTPGIFSTDGTGPGVDGRLPAAPLSNYRSLSFFVRRPIAKLLGGETKESAEYITRQNNLDSSVLHFILANGPLSLGVKEEIILEAKIPLSNFNSVEPGEWARVDIQYRGGTPQVLIENKIVPGVKPEFNSRAAAKISGSSGDRGSSQGESNSMYAAFLLVTDDSTPFPEGSMAIDEIILEDSVSLYRLNNGASVEWTRPGAVLTIRETVIISDLSFQAAIETGAQGNPFEEINDGSFGMNGRSRAEISLLGFRVSGNYSYSFKNAQSAENDYSWSAGHGLSRSFGPFSFQESFDNAPMDRSMNHRLAFSLDTKIRGNITGEAVYDALRLRRRWQAAAGGKPLEKVPLGFTLNGTAGITENTDTGKINADNYAEAWIWSFVDLVPDSGSGAERRELQGNFSLRLDTNPLGSEFVFRGNSLFSRIDNINQNSSLLRMDFPYTGMKRSFRLLFRMEREFRKSVFAYSTDFHNDLNNWGQSFGDAASMMFSFPFYSLFNPGMNERIKDFSSAHESDLSQFADRYEFSVQRAQDYGLASFFLPGRFSFRLSRVLERKLDTPRDVLNLNAGLNFSSINMFGAMGSVPLFGFYQNDEFSHSLQAQISFPKNETVLWSIRSDQAMSFYGISGAELTLNNVLSINSSSRFGEGSRWTNSLASSWRVPMEKTLLGTLYEYFMGMAGRQSSWLTLANLANSDYELFRIESLDLIIERVPSLAYGDYFRYSLLAGHESIVRIFGKLNLSAFGKLQVSRDSNTKILSFMATIGTSLHLMF